MCPNEQILSAYVDNELPERFRIEIFEHIDTCTRCSKYIDRLHAVSRSIQHLNVNRMAEEAKYKTWRNIHKRLLERNRPSVFNRYVRIPMPLIIAAAAVLVISGIFGLVFSAMPLEKYHQNMPIAEIPTFTDMDELLTFLESYQHAGSINMKMPEEPVFLLLSKPTLIHEADYR